MLKAEGIYEATYFDTVPEDILPKLGSRIVQICETPVYFADDGTVWFLCEIKED